MGFELTPTALRDFDEIPADWKTVTLQSVAEIFDCPHSTPLLTDSGPYLVRTQDVRSGTLELDLLARVSEETYLERVKRAIPKFGDLLYSREGTYFGSAALVPSGAKVCLGQRMVHIRPDRLNVDHVFLKYWLNSPVMARHISGLRDGTVAERLNMSTIRALPVAFPDLLSQIEISSTLRSLDDRIDLLRQTNITLEAIAQALFKSWFVDFDPVYAKTEGREPEATDAATSALFPSEFEVSELGLIPNGWSARSLDSIATYLNGLALQKFPPESDDEYLPVIKIAQLRAGNTSSSDRASARLKPDHVVHDGDVLFSWSGSLEVELWCGNDGALNQHLFKVTSNEVPKWFYYLATRLHLPEFRQVAASKATTMGHIQRQHLTRAKVAVPPNDLMAAASEIIGPLIERWITNALQSRELAQLRDTLLPRLISGKLRLPEVEAAIEDAVA